MISLTKIDGGTIIINADEIETVEPAFESTVGLKSGKKLIVKESADSIIELVVGYRQKCYSNATQQLTENPVLKSGNMPD